jgi:hypothetical protein
MNSEEAYHGLWYLVTEGPYPLVEKHHQRSDITSYPAVKVGGESHGPEIIRCVPRCYR